MSRPGAWWSRLVATLRPGRSEAELAEELESHLQLAVDEQVQKGMTPEAARRAALLALGGIEATKERVRDQRRLRALENVVQDARYALRTLARQRLFTVVVVLSFALGIGANTAIFGAVNAVLWAPLPYPDSDRLVMLWSIDRGSNDGTMPVTPADYADWRAATHSFADMATSRDAIYALTGGEGEPETVIGYHFAPEMFRVLGVPAALGRTFAASDGSDVVVLSDHLWRRRYHGDPGIVGRSIRLDQKSYLVVGVMPPAFRHPKQTELWTPLVIPPQLINSREMVILRIVARLRPGVTVEAARAELRAVAANLAVAHPETNQQRGADVRTLRAMHSGDARPALLVLLGSVGFVLLLTSTNISGLSLARAASRGRELAVRSALGAQRGRIVQQLMTESLLLAGVGGVGGLLLARWGADVLVQLFPKNVANLDIPIVEHIPLDGHVVLFSCSATLVAGVLAGLLPALRGSRPDLGAALKEGGRGTTRASRARPFLVAGQIGLALILSSGAGLLITSGLLRQRQLGFDPAHLFTARVMLNGSRRDPGQLHRYLDELLGRLRAAPGVESAGAVNFLPLSGWSDDAYFRLPARPSEVRTTGMLAADPGYFTTMHIPLVRGRGFAVSDDSKAPMVVLVDEHFARRWLGTVDPVGVRLNFGSEQQPDWRQIIGVVGDVMNDPPPAQQREMAYEPLAQSPWGIFGLILRTPGDPVAVAATVRDAVAAMDREQPVSYAMSMDTLVGDALAVSRTSTFIISFFAVLALALAAMGVYGVMAHHVLERRHEIGIRLALGAQPRQVVGFMLRSLVLMTGGGVLLGVAGALAATRVLSALLYGVSPVDPLLLAAMVLLLVGVAALAAYLPLRRALDTDPMIVLRQE